MDTVLIAVTALSLLMAGAMALVVARLAREERARSDARVAALAAMSAEPAAAAPLRRQARVEQRPADVMPRPQPPRAAPLDDFEFRPARAAAPVTGVSDLFADSQGPSPWGRRLAVIGALGAVVLAVAVVLTSRATPTPAGAAGADSSAPAAAAATAPLELLSLRHAQEAQQLVITGLVQNPRSGAPLSRVVATVFAFGPDGAFLTSSRAPLDFTTLAPGVESPFVVNVPVAGQVARYRVGFRTEDGRVIEHVDRRSDAVAQK